MASESKSAAMDPREEVLSTIATDPVAISVKHLDFKFNHKSPVVLHDIDFELPKGCRCLLVGDNGAGKTTLLRVLAGKHMYPENAVTVFGRSAFHDTALNKFRTYMGTDWGRRTVAFSGYGLPIQADIGVHEMRRDLQDAFPERREMLIKLLQIDPMWRMHQVSDGQRRRVQIFLQLLYPFPLILLDEITTDLDVITRSDFLEFLKSECERGATVIYATHVFGGLDDWWTHIAYIHKGKLTRFGALGEIEDFSKFVAEGVHSPLLRTIEGWIRSDRKAAGDEDTPAAS